MATADELRAALKAGINRFQLRAKTANAHTLANDLEAELDKLKDSVEPAPTPTPEPTPEPEPVPPTPSPSPTGLVLGMYSEQGSQGYTGFKNWLGKTPLITDTWSNGQSQQTIIDGINAGWPFNIGSPRYAFGMQLIPDSDSATLATAATGALDQYAKNVANALVNKGQGNCIVRLGWEFGGGWYRWAVKTTQDALNFGKAFERMAKAMKTVPNQAFEFCWNPIWGWQETSPELAYPPDGSVVNHIGIDVYDQSWAANYTSFDARWNDFVNTNYGLNWFVNFSKSKGKPLCYPEWGCSARGDGHGGGDEPRFIEKMYQTFTTTPTSWHVYFNAPSDGNYHLFKIANGVPVNDAGSPGYHFPNAAAKYKQLFAA